MVALFQENFHVSKRNSLKNWVNQKRRLLWTYAGFGCTKSRYWRFWPWTATMCVHGDNAQKWHGNWTVILPAKVSPSHSLIRKWSFYYEQWIEADVRTHRVKDTWVTWWMLVPCQCQRTAGGGQSDTGLRRRPYSLVNETLQRRNDSDQGAQSEVDLPKPWPEKKRDEGVMEGDGA